MRYLASLGKFLLKFFLPLLFLLLLLAVLVGLVASSGTSEGWSLIWKYREAFWRGWLQTILIALMALGLSILMGMGLIALRRSCYRPLRWVSLAIIEVIRGTPLLVQLLFFFYVVAYHVGLENRMVTGVLILSFFSSTYLAEIFRAALAAIPPTQIRVARSLGMNRWEIYYYVIFPQALRHALPAVAGQLASIIKDSSLLSILGIREFTLAAEQVNATTYATLESFFPLALGYFLLTLPISLYSRWLEHRLVS